MIKVGLTGGIGSGKTFIAEVFQNLGVPIFNSDIVAREITDNNSDVKKSLVSHFGKEAYHNDKLNRQFIAGMVFENPELLELMNKIVHPQVEKEFLSWCANYEDKRYIIKEAAIIFETGIYKKLDLNILVKAPEEIRIKRILKRDNTDIQNIRKRMKNQWDDLQKEKLADFILINDGHTLILPQIIEIHNKINESRNY